MTTKSYMWIVGCLCFAAFLAAVGGFFIKLHSTSIPPRPANLPETAVWLRSRTPGIQLRRKGDWVSCSQQGSKDVCLVTTEQGQPEYEGEFRSVDTDRVLPQAQLKPVYSFAITQWMWSRAADKLVPLVPLENGDTLVPAEAYPELKRYVQRALHPEIALSPDQSDLPTVNPESKAGAPQPATSCCKPGR